MKAKAKPKPIVLWAVWNADIETFDSIELTKEDAKMEAEGAAAQWPEYRFRVRKMEARFVPSCERFWRGK